jgi:asparagine synthase (glutamine-hydrolysing)
MSGLALIFHLDGRPAAAGDLAPMLAELAARGPDGEDVVIAGPVALGHRHLATTPEALVEPMPFADSGGGCVLTGDIRLDNRDELLPLFGLDQSGRIVGDGELVLRAWDRWGEGCASHLLGDFAFALWDPRRRIVFAARDQLGMRQLIFSHQAGRVFACSSSARATAAAPGVPRRLNELRLAEALIDFEWGSATATFYADVLRLPPAHCLVVSDQGCTVRAYWTMTPPEPLLLKSDGEYAEAFREVLSRSVRARLRGEAFVGSMLSGGMDSGSVVALACRMTENPLPTFSSVGPDPATCVETRAVHAAITMPNLEPLLLDYSRMEPWSATLIALWMQIEEPFDFHMTQPRICYLAARQRGLKVLLDGVAGDVVLGHGSQMGRHLRAGRLMRAWRDANGATAFWGEHSDSVAAQLFEAARGAFVPEALRRVRASLRDRRAPEYPPESVVDPAFAARVGLDDALRDWMRGDRLGRMTFAEERIWSWPRSGIVVGRERYDRVAAAVGIETRDPFMDRRVLAHCLALPMDQFQADGWPKMILRRAMGGHLPDAVRWRRGKQHLGETFTRTLFGFWPEWRDVLAANAPLLAGRAIPLTSATNKPTDAGPPPVAAELGLQTAIFLARVNSEKHASDDVVWHP